MKSSMYSIQVFLIQGVFEGNFPTTIFLTTQDDYITSYSYLTPYHTA